MGEWRYNGSMEKSVHNLSSGQVLFSSEAESLEAKARWFRSLSVEARMELLCEFTEMILSLNPDIVERKGYAQPASGRILVFRQT